METATPIPYPARCQGNINKGIVRYTDSNLITRRLHTLDQSVHTNSRLGCWHGTGNVADILLTTGSFRRNRASSTIFKDLIELGIAETLRRRQLDEESRRGHETDDVTQHMQVSTQYQHTGSNRKVRKAVDEHSSEMSSCVFISRSVRILLPTTEAEDWM